MSRGNRRVGIMTFHKSWNYGACLQAYATARVIADLGGDPVFIDYANAVEKPKSALELCRAGRLREALITGSKNCLFGCRRYPERAFSAFHAMLPRTTDSYTSLKELSSLEFDVLVSGSDQIWNPDITGGFDDAFLLGFGKAEKRISFASSAGSRSFSEAELEHLRERLSRFDLISVREDYLRDQLASVLDAPVHTVLDPTLLLDGDVWRNMGSCPAGFVEDRDYILVFTLKANAHEDEAVWTHCSEKMGLPVWRVVNNSVHMQGLEKVFHGATPQELLWLMNHARYIITDSFHGTAFSINLGVPFVTLPSKTGNNERALNLLRLVGASDRFAAGGDIPTSEMDYAPIQEVLSQHRRDGLVLFERAFDFDPTRPRVEGKPDAR